MTQKKNGQNKINTQENEETTINDGPSNKNTITIYTTYKGRTAKHYYRHKSLSIVLGAVRTEKNSMDLKL